MCPGVCRAPCHTPCASLAAPGKESGAGWRRGGKWRGHGGGRLTNAGETAEARLFLTCASAVPTGSPSGRGEADVLGGALPWAPGTGCGLLGYPEHQEGKERVLIRVSALQT